MTGRRRPPNRMVALAGALVVAALLVGLVQAVNLLRHPMPDDLPAVPELDDPAADPRTEVVCEEPEPIEGVEREDDADAADRPTTRITSNDLLDCPETYHRRSVRYRGEVVGAVLRRADGAWVQLNDDVYAVTRGPLPAHRDYRGGNAGIGVFIPHELADEIDIVGGPQFRGDVLEVTGEYRRIDHERLEAAVIVASEGQLVFSGRPIEDPVLPERRGIAFGLALLAAAVVALERVIAARR